MEELKSLCPTPDVRKLDYSSSSLLSISRSTIVPIRSKA